MIKYIYYLVGPNLKYSVVYSIKSTQIYLNKAIL